MSDTTVPNDTNGQIVDNADVTLKPKEETDDQTKLNSEFELPSPLGEGKEHDGEQTVSLVLSVEEKDQNGAPVPSEEEKTNEKGNDEDQNGAPVPSEEEKKTVKENEIIETSSLEQEVAVKKTDLKFDEQLVVEDEQADSSVTQNVDSMELQATGLIQNEATEDDQQNETNEMDFDPDEITPEENDEPFTPLWEEEKEKCVNATIEERRTKKRKCTELPSIETWPDYYNKRLNKGNEAEPEFSEISSKISIWKGDITSLLIDAIVNAANEKLMGGGGVDGAIHSAAGPLLGDECKDFNGRSAGESVITAGYDLPARYVIHTVGPRGENQKKLKECYLSSLQLLLDNKQRSIAFPCISTGIFGYPNDKAAEVVLKTVREWLEKNHKMVDRVIFCHFLDKDVHIYEKKMQQYFPMMGGSIEDMSAEHTATEVERNEDGPSSDPSALEKNPNYAIEQGEGETASLISTAHASSNEENKKSYFDRFKNWFMARAPINGQPTEASKL